MNVKKRTFFLMEEEIKVFNSGSSTVCSDLITSET